MSLMLVLDRIKTKIIWLHHLRTMDQMILKAGKIHFRVTMNLRSISWYSIKWLWHSECTRLVCWAIILTPPPHHHHHPPKKTNKQTTTNIQIHSKSQSFLRQVRFALQALFFKRDHHCLYPHHHKSGSAPVKRSQLENTHIIEIVLQLSEGIKQDITAYINWIESVSSLTVSLCSSLSQVKKDGHLVVVSSIHIAYK